MDLRAYYEKIRKIEAVIEAVFAVVISRATPDGGRAGVKTELPRAVAARLIADGKADLANAGRDGAVPGGGGGEVERGAADHAADRR